MSVTVTLPSTAGTSGYAAPASIALRRCPKCGEGLIAAGAAPSSGSSPLSTTTPENTIDKRDPDAVREGQKRRIDELEGEVKILTERATTAGMWVVDSVT